MPRRRPPIRDLENLEINLPRRVRVVLRLQHRILDGVPPTLPPHLRLRFIRQPPLDPVDAHELRQRQLRREAAQLREVPEPHLQPRAGGEAARERLAVLVGWVPGSGGQGRHAPVRDLSVGGGLAGRIFQRHGFQADLELVRCGCHVLRDLGLGIPFGGDGDEDDGALGVVGDCGLTGADDLKGSHLEKNPTSGPVS